MDLNSAGEASGLVVFLSDRVNTLKYAHRMEPGLDAGLSSQDRTVVDSEQRITTPSQLNQIPDLQFFEAAEGRVNPGELRHELKF